MATPLYSYSSAVADVNYKKTIRTAACLIIGDEVLGGKVVDTNSSYLAKFCFRVGIDLKRIEVISDDEDEIIEAVRRMSKTYDFVVTSGGIGPTHDDITYPSIAKAFQLPLQRHEEAYSRMRRLMKPTGPPGGLAFRWDQPSAALTARLRMVQLPHDEGRDPTSQVLFPLPDAWVPVAVVNGNVYILPGVPRLFCRLLDALEPALRRRLPEGLEPLVRVTIETPLPESVVAEFLTELAARVAPEGIKVGSYPRWHRKFNLITLVGRNEKYIESLVPEVCTNTKGRRIELTDSNEEEGPDNATKDGVTPPQQD